MTTLQQLFISIAISILGFLISCLIEKSFSRVGLAVAVLLFCASSIVEVLINLNRISSELETNAKISNVKDPILKQYCEDVRLQVDKMINMALQGRAEIKTVGEMMIVYHQIFRNCQDKDQIYATSLVDIKAVWGTQLGNDVLKSNHEAIQRGATVARIFLLDGICDLPKAEPIFKQHKDAGVIVYWIEASKISESDRRDFLVTSRGHVLEFLTNQEGRMRTSFYEANNERASERRKAWEGIKAYSTLWVP